MEGSKEARDNGDVNKKQELSENMNKAHENDTDENKMLNLDDILCQIGFS